MTYRWMNVGFMLLILAVAGVYLWLSRDLAMNRLRDDLGPIMFPVVLAIGVVILSLIELVRTARSTDETQAAPFRIEGVARLVATIMLVATYYVVWERLGAFYPATAGLVLALILLFRWRPNRRDLITATIVAVGFTLFLYFVFDVAFGINFTH